VAVVAVVVVAFVGAGLIGRASVFLFPIWRRVSLPVTLALSLSLYLAL
jgi:hypothetical protein